MHVRWRLKVSIGIVVLLLHRKYRYFAGSFLISSYIVKSSGGGNPVRADIKSNEVANEKSHERAKLKSNEVRY